MDIVVVRLQSHGHRFELPCHRNKLEEYMRKGRGHPPDLSTRIVVHPSVFTNCHRRELATNANLLAAFQTTAFDIVAQTILQFGDVVVNEKDRQEKKHEKRELQETVIKLTGSMLLNKFSGAPPDDSALREELRATKEARCVEHVDPMLQAAFFASVVVRRDRLDCRRVPRGITLVYPHRLEADWNDFLLDFDGLVMVKSKRLVPVLAQSEMSAAQSESSSAITSSSSTSAVELSLLFDGMLEAVGHVRWKKMVDTMTESKSVFDVSESDVDAFSRYDFVLPAAEASVDADLTNRLQALDKLKKDACHDDDSGRSPVKGRKHKQELEDETFSDEDSGDRKSKQRSAQIVSKYDVMTHKQIQELCKKYKLSTGGKKQDLVERLEAFDETSKPKIRT